MKATTLFNIGFAVLTFFLIRILKGTNAAAISAIPNGDSEQIEFRDYIVHRSGKRMPLVPLVVEGELFPGGPLYRVEGNSFEEVQRKLQNTPGFNATAFGNSTVELPDDSDNGLQERDRQVYNCMRKPRDFDGIIPEDIKPGIDKLLQPPWKNAFCYAAANACTFLVCSGEAGIFLCNHRTTTVRTVCGSACGRFAYNTWNRMMKDKRRGAMDPSALCLDWKVRNFRYIGWSWRESDMSWEVDIVPYRGKPCRLNQDPQQ
ncbi:hypothetical protein TWF730_009255 [Orbilia blumenaviensis]|uniref:Uncharacterized protein n=1 Tax=Orbilia blumenaviensis TaxID=1796055 RepID=A0AAV9UY18_9PEZI